jgi:hypothetical protein
VWGPPLNATDFQNAKKVLQDVNITEKTRQAIRDGIESGKNFKGELQYIICWQTKHGHYGLQMQMEQKEFLTVTHLL